MTKKKTTSKKILVTPKYDKLYYKNKMYRKGEKMEVESLDGFDNLVNILTK